ncbi:hypothetical protein P7K49_040237 [Saguinus oedipus]|uniref:Uncharacterized protein n=1 Tax=Saguinus oedipus TaxID=9490 RepID=A0ABQ9T8Q0_SAGOE|nr:hypothetical protein P7K49_040237 [Saguinus oedipus]
MDGQTPKLFTTWFNKATRNAWITVDKGMGTQYEGLSLSLRESRVHDMHTEYRVTIYVEFREFNTCSELRWRHGLAQTCHGYADHGYAPEPGTSAPSAEYHLWPLSRTLVQQWNQLSPAH